MIRMCPKERAEEFFAAATEPKEMKWYEAGHGLNTDATLDRKAWLKENLGLNQIDEIAPTGAILFQVG